MKKVVVHVYPLLWVYLVWQLLSVATGCSAALSVVISGSMEPQIKRGDLLFAVGPDRGDELRPGDIVLYRLPHRPEIPIVHRIIDVVPPSPQSTAAAPQPSLLEVQYLTKGDANKVDDRGLVAPSYPSGLVPKEAILGASPCHIVVAWLPDHPHAGNQVRGVRRHRTDGAAQHSCRGPSGPAARRAAHALIQEGVGLVPLDALVLVT